jgi:CheY-like chemotaxis protein
LQLADGDGRELLQGIRADQRFARLPVVVFTNHLASEASCRRIGVSEFVHKPLSYAAFRETFLGILERYAADRLHGATTTPPDQHAS